ncbi:hypothetical protein AAH995_24960 [Pseudomonas putida]|uniref:hypothetical protein n=1 Tax=Pseudomonas putida group TaxID=136845 RepID=UPI00349F0269
MASWLEGGHQGGPCTGSEKVQACRKNAGGAGGAGRPLRAVGVLAGIALLAACAGKVEPQIQYVRVEVPVQVPCRTPEVAVPAWSAAGLRKTDSLEVKVRALLAERRQRIGYERQLAAASVACQ